MNIHQLRSLLSQGEIDKWIPPENISGIDRAASKHRYKALWDAPISSIPITSPLRNPESDAKAIFEYVDACLSTWAYLKEDNLPIPREMEIKAPEVARACVFLARELGYVLGLSMIIDVLRPYATAEDNRTVFNVLEEAFTAENEPYLKYILQELLLEFFGFLANFTEPDSSNWIGLSDENLERLKFIAKNRLLVTHPQ